MAKKYASKSLKFEVIYQNKMNLLNGIQDKAEKGLKSLEPYTKTDMVYLARGGFWLGIGQFVSSLSAFLTSIAFANLLSPDAFGIYKYIISINSLLLITTLSGMDSAVTQSIARGFDGTLNTGVREKMKWGVLGTILSFCIALYYFFQGNMILSIGFSITAVFIPLVESFDMYNSLLWGKKLFNIQTKYNIIKKLIALLCMIGIIFITQNLYLILLTYFISIVLPNIYFLYRTEKLYKTNDNADPEAMAYGKKLSFINTITLVMGELDKILIFQFVGAANLAVYSLALAPTDQIKGLLKNINSLAMPQFSKRTGNEIRNNIFSKIKTLTIATTTMVIMYVLVAPYFYKIFFPKYLDSVLPSQILAISLIPVIIAGFIYTILESQKSTKEIYNYNIYSSSISIIILIPLIYFCGLWGAIFARVINRVITLIISLNLIKKIN